MGKNDAIELTGTVTKVLAGSMYNVILPECNDLVILCYLSGKMRKNFIKIAIGDKVKVEVSPYDLTKGRIVYRFR
jgi:translation initiation factor IF-1